MGTKKVGRTEKNKSAAFPSLLAATCFLTFLGIREADAKVGLIMQAGILQYSGPTFIQDTEFGASSSTGYGLGLVFSGASKWSFELGTLLYTRTLDSTVSDNVIGVQSLQMSGGLRRSLGKFVSLGLGGYYDYTLSTRLDGEAASSSYPSDFGISGGLRIKIPVAKSVGIFAQGNYNYGLLSVDGTSATQIVVTGGLTWGVP